jgi:multidrug efflux system outer membrane protein
MASVFPLVLAAGLLLGGCATTVPPIPAQAGVAVPMSWAQPVPAGSETLAAWWRVFDDPLLVELVEASQRANPSIAIARANVRQARANRAEAAASLWPSLSGSLGARHAGGGSAGTRTTVEFGVDAGWDADLSGANRHAVGAQDALVSAGTASLGAAQVAVAAEVALAYLDVRSAQVRAAVARENLASQQETLQISRWREQAGLANAIEVQQALGAAEQTRAALPLQEAAAAQAAHALAVLTGSTPAELLARVGAAPLLLPQARQAVAVAVPASALRQRPDVQAAEQRLRAAAEQVGAADAARRPGLQLAAALAWSGATLGAAASGGAARSLLASLAQPLFDAGRLNARLEGRQAEFDAAGESYRASVLAALQEAEDALAGLAAGRKRLAALQVALEAARLAALLATQRHASGLIDFQTVLETQRTLLTVQEGVVVAQAQLAAGHVRLYKALGGGWQPQAPEVLP